MMSLGKILKAAAFGALAFSGVVFAGSDEELAAMKAAMESMKAEMAQVKADYANARGQAGGEPGGLTSADGKATIRIGGFADTTYGLGFVSSPVNNYSDNSKTTRAGWAQRVGVNFTIDLSSDTSAYINLRPDNYNDGKFIGGIVDAAYYQWRNVGGSQLTLDVGYKSVPFGMSGNGDVGGYDWNKVLITDPFTKHGNNQGDFPRVDFGVGGYQQSDYSSIGVFGKYALIEDQLFLKAGIFASKIKGLGNTIDSNWPGRTDKNENRNIGLVDHVIALAWNPCYVEGLHLEASYMATFDTYGSAPASAPVTNGVPDGYKVRDGATGPYHNSSSYNPSFSLAAAYKVSDKFGVAAEFVLDPNTKFMDAYAHSLSVSGNYNVTDKFALALGADWAHFNWNQRNGDLYALGNDQYLDSDLYVDSFRLTLGGKYTFSNGIFVAAQYYHDFVFATCATLQDRSGATHDADVLLVRTGYNF